MSSTLGEYNYFYVLSHFFSPTDTTWWEITHGNISTAQITGLHGARNWLG